tara:strand:+ start:204 stop:437 length:234 start_codon:yes stop_codon:yes gene_type:complete
MHKTKHPALIKLGENIRQIRESQGISQEELAEKADLDRTYIGGVERGERNLTILSTLKLCRALGVELNDLTKGVKNA